MQQDEESFDSSHDPGESPAAADRLTCPGCQEQVDIPPESAHQLVRCPYCNTDFFASHEQAHLLVVDDTPPNSAEIDRESAFDKLRIENYTALRMGAIRARSWWTIAQWMSILIVLDMLGKTIIEVSTLRQWGIFPTLRTAVVITGCFFARHAHRRAAEFKREIDRSALAEPTVPPDFSTLSNGSDRWKNLEDVR